VFHVNCKRLLRYLTTNVRLPVVLQSMRQ
jgi:hypothetical protein